MSFIGATGLNSFEEEIANLQTVQSVQEQNESELSERLDELEEKVGEEGVTETDPPLLGTGLFGRIELQETLVGNPKVVVLGVQTVPATGLFHKTDDLSDRIGVESGDGVTATGVYSYVDTKDTDLSDRIGVESGDGVTATGVYAYVDTKDTALSDRIGVPGSIAPPSEPTGLYEYVDGVADGLQTEIDTLADAIGADILQDEASGFFDWVTGGIQSWFIGGATVTAFGSIGIIGNMANDAKNKADAAETTANTANTTANTANTTANTADGKANNLLTIINNGTVEEFEDNTYLLKSGNVGIGKVINENLDNKLEVKGNINISSGIKFKRNNVNLSYSDLDGTLPIATDSTIGAVKVDNTTITVDEYGELTVVGGGTSLTAETLLPNFSPSEFVISTKFANKIALSNSIPYTKLEDNPSEPFTTTVGTTLTEEPVVVSNNLIVHYKFDGDLTNSAPVGSIG